MLQLVIQAFDKKLLNLFIIFEYSFILNTSLLFCSTDIVQTMVIETKQFHRIAMGIIKMFDQLQRGSTFAGRGSRGQMYVDCSSLL